MVKEDIMKYQSELAKCKNRKERRAFEQEQQKLLRMKKNHPKKYQKSEKKLVGDTVVGTDVDVFYE